MTKLAEAFVARLSDEAQASFDGHDGLAEHLAELHEQGVERWPTVELEAAEFARHLAERVKLEQGADSDPLEALAALRAADLYLACACLRDDQAAISAFCETLLPGVRASLARFGSPPLSDEMCQKLTIKLFVPREGKPPTIAKYNGRGSLQAWVNVIAVRDTYTHLRLAPREQPEEEIDALVEHVIETKQDAELDQLKQMYRAQFKQAFAIAFEEALSARERNLLRHEYLDGLNIDRIGAIYSVHRATVARWRNSARDKLFAHTKQVFESELKLSESEFQSVLKLIQSQLTASLPRLLAKDKK